jgi:hypothetical protein
MFADGRSSNTTFDSIDIWDSISNTWTTEHLSTPRAVGGAATIGHYALFAGGRIYEPTQQLSDVVDIYNGLTGTWSVAQLSQARDRLTAVAAGDQAFFAGGLQLFDWSDRVDIFTVIPEPGCGLMIVTGGYLFVMRRTRVRVDRTKL